VYNSKTRTSGINDMVSRIAAAAQRLFTRSRMTQQSVILVIAVVIGLAAGVGVGLTKLMLIGFHRLFFVYGRYALGFMGDYYVILLPALGGLLVGPLVYVISQEARGHGVPEIMQAMVQRGGRIRARVSAVKALASALCIGSGGSVGSEGPTAQIGAGIGSTVGQLLHLSDNRIKTLVGCGAAAGIAATFSSPLAGAFFALEILLGDVSAEAFAPVVASAVTATAFIVATGIGPIATLHPPEVGIASYTELPVFVVLGILAAAVGILFVRSLTMFEEVFERLPLPNLVLPAIGGLGVGAIGFFYPTIFGSGYDAMAQITSGRTAELGLMIALLGLKILASSLTLGSGGSGGVFSPSLFMGAALGTGIWHAFKWLFPSLMTQSGAYAMVGMGAVFAAAAHAPITSILIVFEITHDYYLILPLMLACVTSVVVARAMYRFSIYNIRLVRRGVHFELGRDTRLLNEIQVSEGMTTDIISVKPDSQVREIAHLFETTKHHGFPVVDDSGKLHGCVTLTDVRNAGPEGLDKRVKDIATHDLVIAFPDENLNDALRKLGLRDVGRLPVVPREDHSRILGLITRKNIISAYNRALMRRHTKLDQVQDEEYFE